MVYAHQAWRPGDVAEKYPVDVIDKVYDYQKYNPQSSMALHLWCWIQFLSVFLLMIHLFNNFSVIGFPGVLIYGLFLVFCIFSYSMLMDRNPYSGWVEMAKAVVGILLAWQQGDWFYLGEMIPFGAYWVLGFFVLSAMITTIFVKKELSAETQRTTSLA